MKKKTYIILIGVVALIVLVVGFLASPLSPLRKEVIHIALAGPMSGFNKDNGEDMLRGVTVALEKASREGRLKHKSPKLLVYDDTDTHTAVKIASDIANENKVLLVIGHYDSDNSLVAGTIYKKTGIAALTASATSDDIIRDNEWYLRTIPGNRHIVRFIAAYLKNEMNTTSASVIYSKNNYGLPLAEFFESESKRLGIGIGNKWGITDDEEKSEQESKRIIGQLRAAKERGIIFCATHQAEAAAIMASLRYPGTDYGVMGADALSTSSFISGMNKYPSEQMSPGYFSDGIFAVSPFIPHLAVEKEVYTSFRKEYVAKYGTEPSGLAANYYDATLVAMRGIEMAGIRGLPQSIREDRLKLRDALYRINREEVAVNGVTGHIFFNELGDVTKPLDVGVWQKQKFLPAFVQYQDIHGDSEDTVKIGDRELKKVRVVYAGMDINEIRHPNIAKKTFSADFYLWFRFRGYFDDSNIEFVNATAPIRLGQPVLEKRTNDNITLRAYRVIAEFRTDPTDYVYPFETCTLRLAFRHADKARTNLLYVSDVLGLPEFDKEKNIEATMVHPISGWKAKDIASYQDVMNVIGADKKAASFSRFNTTLRIRRTIVPVLFIKFFFPIIAIFVVSYLICFVPPSQSVIRAIMLMLIFPITVLAHSMYSAALPVAAGNIGYVFFTIYGLTGIIAVISVFVHTNYKRGNTKHSAYLFRAGKIVYPVLLAIAVTFLIFFPK